MTDAALWKLARASSRRLENYTLMHSPMDVQVDAEALAQVLEELYGRGTQLHLPESWG